MSTAAPASTQYKPSWASLSSTAAPSAANSWDVDSTAPPDAPQGTFNIPAGLPPVPMNDEEIAAENARLAVENEMLRMQCMQAQAAAVQAAMVAPYLNYPAMSNQVPWPTQEQRKRKGAAKDAQRPRVSSSNSIKSRPSGEVEPHPGAEEAQDEAGDVPEGPKTTVMIRNLPNNFSRAMLVKLLDSEGFQFKYDFVYLPIDFKSNASLGYAFINLVTPEEATRFWDTFEGYSNWSLPSQKVSSVNWSTPHQGLEAHIERFRNSPVMHDSVPDENRPILLQDGQRLNFPPPTKKIRAPRVRPGRAAPPTEEGMEAADA